MSNRYKGGVISATPPTTSSGNDGVASGAWTLEQQMQLKAAGLWPNQPVYYIEDVFSTYLYTGTGAAQTITNGINLSGKGGLVWLKNRSGANDHGLFDTIRGAGYRIVSNLSDAENFSLNYISSFGSTGFSLGAPSSSTNASGNNYASWTFQKQAKFFDVLTYTGNGTAGTAIAHSLGSTPGFILVKRTDTGGSTGQNWAVWHRSAGGTGYFNSTNALDSSFPNSIFWGDGSNYVAPTSTTFTVTTSQNVNASGGSYVAYLFAHNAGGFGLTGTDNVISCGSFTTDGSGNASVTLGYEPQWVLMKPATTATSGNWIIADNMRGWTVDGAGGNANQQLYANSSSAESGGTPANLTSTGFNFTSSYAPWASQTWIYIAIRRGPMKVPTSGTSVFAPVAYTGNGSAGRNITSSNTTDLSIIKGRDGGSGTSGGASSFTDRLRGGGSLGIADTQGDMNSYWSLPDWLKLDVQTGIQIGATAYTYSNAGGGTYVNYTFSRAAGFFDTVCYTGTGSATTQAHNLTVAPELMIVKVRDTSSTTWAVYSAALGNTYTLSLSTTAAQSGPSSANWNSTTPTSSVFSLGAGTNVNASGLPYVAYLFATAAGVSKVGSYTGSSSSDVVVDCGFTAGARFVLIKRTDTTGDWYIYDTARGINPSNDPYLLMNSDAIEVTGTNYIGPYSTGFYVNTGTPLNATTGASYIFLAIA